MQNELASAGPESMQPFHIRNTAATPSSTQEQGESSSNTPQPHSIVHDLANQIRQASGPNFQSTLGDAQLIVNHVRAKNKRLDDFQATLSNWVALLPETEKKSAEKIVKRLLNAPPDRKTITLEFTQNVLPNFVAFFPRLETLDIATTTEELPPFIAQTQNLKTLTLRAENLTKLPDNMGNLNKLTAFTLKKCHKIHELPNSMGTLSKLTTLGIVSSEAHNPLPHNIHILQNLKIVYLYSCNTLGNTLTQLEHINGLRKLCLYKTPVHTADLHRINKLKNLKSLEISSCNTLEHIPQILCELQYLIELLLMRCNSLQFIPESIGRLKNLQTLKLTKCSTLETLPESIGELQKLRGLIVSQCTQLSSLPNSIVSLPHNCQIDLSDTGLSVNVLENLSRQTELSRQQSNGTRGPQVHFSLPPSATEPVGSLAEETLKWFREADSPDPLPPNATHTIEQLAPPMANALATLLARFRKTAQYLQSPKDTAQRIHGLLSQLLKHPPLLESCCAMALESNQTCDDRTALGLLHIELALFEYTLILFVHKSTDKNQSYGTAHNLAQSIFKQRRLMDIEHSDNLDNIAFLNFLAAWHPWQETVKHHDPLVHQGIQAQQTHVDSHHEHTLKTKLEEYAHACESEPDGEFSAKALDKFSETNQIRDQREQDRLAAWHPHIYSVFKHTPAQSSTAQPNKRARVD